MPIAFVHGAGGSKGAFGVGAFKYLYEQGIRPNILCGSSAGSINSTKLAEGEGAIAQLEQLWLGLRANSDMYAPEPWFSAITDSRLRKYVVGMIREPLATLGNQIESWEGLLDWPIGAIRDFMNTVEDAQRLLNAIQTARSARSVFNLDPITRLMRGDRNSGIAPTLDPFKVRQSGIKLRIAIVGLDDGQLRYVTETGAVLERDNRTQVALGHTLKPECQALADQLAILESSLDAWQIQLHEPGANKTHVLAKIKSLNAEIAKKGQELEQCVATKGYDTVTSTDLIFAVVASSSIPGAFPPIRIGGQHYVDGGVREMVPIQAALDLGADKVYAVVVSAPLPYEPPEKHSDVGGILRRSLTDIMPEETTFNEASPPRGYGVPVTIIRPSVDLHTALVIDPGLISISIAYGYMRAADTLAGRTSSDGMWALADEIVQLRKDIWRLECVRFGHPVPTDEGPGLFELLTELAPPPPAPQPNYEREILVKKQQLNELVRKRRLGGGQLPADADQWWDRWERHPWDPPPFPPMPTPGVQVTPERVPPDRPVSLTVKAYNAVGAELSGQVIVGEREIGRTGAPFTHTFPAKYEDVIDPETKVRSRRLIDPVGEVRVPKYQATEIGFVFDRAAEETEKPKIEGIQPSGGRPGESLVATISGSALEGSTTVTMGEGISAVIMAAKPDAIDVRLTIASNAPPGRRSLEVTTPRGRVNSGTSVTFQVVQPYPYASSRSITTGIGGSQL